MLTGAPLTSMATGTYLCLAVAGIGIPGREGRGCCNNRDQTDYDRFDHFEMLTM